MKYNTPLAFAFILAPFLAACTTTEPQTVSMDYLLTNPLVAERYADELVDAMVELKIQDNPLLEDEAKADLVEDTRTKWLEAARDATALQREGTRGRYVIVHAYGKGEFLFLNNVLYIDSVFEVTPGPNLHVYMTTEVDPRDVEFPDETAIDLGPLQTPYGAHRYQVTLPAEADAQQYRTVVIWEEDLEQVWGFVQLQK